MPKPRSKAVRAPRRKLFIFCEGEKTEPNYIKGYIGTLSRKALRDVIQVQPTRKNTPAQLVDVAIAQKNGGAGLAGDVFWVVYDRENVTKYSDELHDKAYKKAKDNNVNIALSNVCFEMWLLLHFFDTAAPYASFDDLFHRSQFRARYKVQSGGLDYEKSNQNVYEVVSGFIGDARVRAAKINKAALDASGAGRSKPHHLNPYTDMPRLLDAIDNFS